MARWNGGLERKAFDRKASYNYRNNMRNGIKMSPILRHSRKLSWKDTASEMARDDESWKDFKNTVDDGLVHLPFRCPSGTSIHQGRLG